MTFMRTKAPLAKGAFIVLAAAAFAAVLWVPEARAQQPAPPDFNSFMRNRQELSARSVDEIRRRRFEEGKSDSNFPSDAANSAKPGLLHALTPEERKALQHNERGLDLFSKGKLDGAIKAYQEAIRFDPKLAAAQNNLGTAYFSVARFEEAAAAFRLACELDQNYGQAFFNLALTQIKLGQQKEADETLNAALVAYNATGETHLRAGRFKEAEEAFRGMLQFDPEYSPALVRLALVYNAAGRHEEAAQYVRRVAEREPTNAAAHEIFAEALYGLQKYDEAAAWAERAIKLSPDFAYALYFAGSARASLGQRDAALAHLARLQQLKSPDLAQQLSEFINKKAPAKQ